MSTLNETDLRAQKLLRMRERQQAISEMNPRAVRPFRFDGYANMMNKWGTKQDTTEHYRFHPEPDVPDQDLTMLYEGNGLFAKIIDTPAEEAIKHGFELKDVSDAKIQAFYEEALDALDWDEKASTAIKWARLFGGALMVMMVDDDAGVDTAGYTHGSLMITPIPEI